MLCKNYTEIKKGVTLLRGPAAYTMKAAKAPNDGEGQSHHCAMSKGHILQNICPHAAYLTHTVNWYQ